MAIVMINTDKISNNLVPDIGKLKSSVFSVLEKAGGVNLPYNCPYSWSDIVNNISDCSDKLDNYLIWIKEISRLTDSAINNARDDLNKLVVEEIKIQKVVVK